MLRQRPSIQQLTTQLLFRRSYRSFRTPSYLRPDRCHILCAREINIVDRSEDRTGGQADADARSSMSEHVRSLQCSPCDSDSYTGDAILSLRSIVESGSYIKCVFAQIINVHRSRAKLSRYLFPVHLRSADRHSIRADIAEFWLVVDAGYMAWRQSHRIPLL